MSIYGLGGAAARAIQFLLLPVYTRVLSPSNYGSLELVYIIAGILAILYGFMIKSGYLRCYFDSQGEEHRRVILGSAFWFTVFSSVVFAAVSFIFAEYIASRIFKFEEGALFIKLITISIAIKALSLVFYNVLMAQEKPKEYVMVNVITLFVMMAVTIYMVAGLRWGVGGVLVAQIVAYSVELIILSSLLLRRTIFHYSFAAVKEMLKFSIPLIPLQITAFVLAMSDRFFLQEFRSMDEVGLYSLGYKFAAILPLLTIEPFKAFGPHIFSLIDQPEKCKRLMADFARYYLAASLFLALGIAMFSREIILIMSDSGFHSSYRVIYMLCISYVFYGLYSFSCYANNIVKKNWIISLAWLLASIINISLNFYMIPRFGIFGAAGVSVLSYFVLVLCNLIATHKIYPIQYKYSHFIMLLALTTGVYYLSTLPGDSIAASLIIKAILLIGYLVIVYYGGYFTREERFRVKNFVLSLFGKSMSGVQPG